MHEGHKNYPLKKHEKNKNQPARGIHIENETKIVDGITCDAYYKAREEEEASKCFMNDSKENETSF